MEVETSSDSNFLSNNNRPPTRLIGIVSDKSSKSTFSHVLLITLE